MLAVFCDLILVRTALLIAIRISNWRHSALNICRVIQIIHVIYILFLSIFIVTASILDALPRS